MNGHDRSSGLVPVAPMVCFTMPPWLWRRFPGHLDVHIKLIWWSWVYQHNRW